MPDKETILSAATKQTDDQNSLVKKLNEDFGKSWDFMRIQRSQWRINELTYRNKCHNLPINFNDRLTQIMANLSLAVIQTQMPTVAVSIPVGDVMPDEKDDVEWSDLIGKMDKQLSNSSELRSVHIEAGFDSKMYGNGLWTNWPDLIEALEQPKPLENKANEELAEGSVRTLDDDVPNGGKKMQLKGYNPVNFPLFQWFPSPDSTGVDIFKNSAMQQIAVPTLRTDILADYPGVEEILPKSFSWSKGGINEFRAFKHHLPDSGRDNSTEFGLKLISIFRDAEHPNGRVVKTVGDVLLSDEPYFSKRKISDREYQPTIPMYLVKNYGSKNALFGMGETELLYSIQKAFNEIVSSTGDNIRQTGNPAWKVTKEWQNTQKYRIRGTVNEQIPVRNLQQDIERISGVQLPGTTFAFLELLLNLSEIIPGVNETSRGDTTVSQQSGTAVSKLQSKAESRQSFETRKEFKEEIKRDGRNRAYFIQNFSTEVQQIKKKSANGDTEFEEFNPNAKLSGKTIKDSIFEIDVQAGSVFPEGSAAWEEQNLLWREMGLVSNETVILNSTIPDKAAAIVHVRNQTALTGLQAEIEAENEARPEFVKLVNKALSLFKNEDTRDLFFTGPDFTAENLLDMIIKFPEFEDTNEFYALPTPYAEFLYQGKLSRQNDAQDLQNEVEQTGGVV